MLENHEIIEQCGLEHFSYWLTNSKHLRTNMKCGRSKMYKFFQCFNDIFEYLQSRSKDNIDIFALFANYRIKKMNQNHSMYSAHLKEFVKNHNKMTRQLSKDEYACTRFVFLCSKLNISDKKQIAVRKMVCNICTQNIACKH